MQLHVDVWSDFVCPWCYLVSTSLEKLQASHGVSVRWKSYELRPKGSPPMPDSYKARIEAMQPKMIAIAKNQYGVEINQGPFEIDSRPAHVGQKFAEDYGLGAAFHKAAFEAYWLQAKNIEDHEVLGDIAAEVGLNRDNFLAALDDEKFEAKVEADVMQAYQYELRGVPALIFEDKYYIPGAQPYEELVRIVEQLEQRVEQGQ